MLSFITDLAKAAGNICLEESKSLQTVEVTQKGLRDLVTEVDKKVEHFLRAKISAQYPEHGFIGEEEGNSGDISQHCWVIDPIDGTTSFIQGLPGYAVSIAYREQGVTQAGVVFAPVLGQLFSARRGGGATLNGEPIHVSRRSDLAEAVMATGFACLRRAEGRNNIGYFNQILRRIMDFRRMGAAALDLAYVACGKFDGFWELNLNDYDIAAGVLLVEEAGGRMCDFAGGGNYPANGIIATNGCLTEPLLEIIRAVDAAQ